MSKHRYPGTKPRLKLTGPQRRTMTKAFIEKLVEESTPRKQPSPQEPPDAPHLRPRE